MEDRLVTDLREIARLAEQKDEENWAFRYWVKNHVHRSDRELDSLVREINMEVSAHIDCDKCRNCCAQFSPELGEADVKRMAAKLGITTEDFEDRYVELSEFGERVAIGPPCPFLVGLRCIMEEARPVECRYFPFLKKSGFRSRLMGVVGRAGVCPIVYNVLEELKRRLGYRPKGHRRRWR